MCYNYSNYIRTDSGMVNKYKLPLHERKKLMDEFAERYGFIYTSGFEHALLPIVTMDEPDLISFYNWGLIPHWAKDRQKAMDIRKVTLNATCEGVFEKPSFKPYIRKKRCLIPATGFFEWHSQLGAKYPYHIQVLDYDFPDDFRQFCFGGLYSQWVDSATGEVIRSFSIITTPANEKMEFIHNSKKRMPLILHEFDEEKWLDPKLTDEQLNALMQPYPSKYMRGYSISKLITAKVDRNVPKLLEPEFYEQLPDVV